MTFLKPLFNIGIEILLGHLDDVGDLGFGSVWACQMLAENNIVDYTVVCRERVGKIDKETQREKEREGEFPLHKANTWT